MVVFAFRTLSVAWFFPEEITGVSDGGFTPAVSLLFCTCTGETAGLLLGCFTSRALGSVVLGFFDAVSSALSDSRCLLSDDCSGLSNVRFTERLGIRGRTG